MAVKVAQEKAMLAGPVPVHILRAAQFQGFMSQTRLEPKAGVPP
jgi:hypothetical protein